jgi:hypothetical protein
MKKPKTKKPKAVRKERRFAPSQTQTSTIAAVAGMAGALALGAGVYAMWIREPRLDWAQYLIAAGALVLGGALWFSDSSADPLRVGDAGIAVEKGEEFERIAWCDLTRVSVENGQLVLDSEELTLKLPIAPHRTAIAWILKEGVMRVPDVMDVKTRDSEGLPDTAESDGEMVAVEGLQIAGKHCKASGKPITFEKDARLCPTCAEVYHRDAVPKKCATCGDDIAHRAYQP